LNLIEQKKLTGERALFKGENLEIVNSTFSDGESPLKESRNIKISGSVFEWKYPLWYSENIKVSNSVFLETARSGIWYTKNIVVSDTVINAPKMFRRSVGITLKKVEFPKADETMWSCKNAEMNNVTATGDYFGMNSEKMKIYNFSLTGNYCFDGAKNIEIHNSRLISKDAFWNCENVTVYDSVIIGEYLGWNSKNLTFINCYIKSEQGLCYVENLVIRNSKLIDVNLAFEYSTVHVESITIIDSIKNPAGGEIISKDIKEIILDDKEMDFKNTKIIIGKAEEKYAI
jgi:hypothetical protein